MRGLTEHLNDLEIEKGNLWREGRAYIKANQSFSGWILVPWGLDTVRCVFQESKP